MALGRGADDREPQARAGLAARAAPEASERLLGVLRREPRPFVGNRQPGNPVLLLHADRDQPAFWPVELRVPDEVRERAFERGAISPDRDGLECARLDARARGGASVRSPPVALPCEPGRWTECVASKQTGAN